MGDVGDDQGRQDFSVGFLSAQTTHDNEHKVLQSIFNVKLMQTINLKASKKKNIVNLTLEYAYRSYWFVTSDYFKQLLAVVKIIIHK